MNKATIERAILVKTKLKVSNFSSSNTKNDATQKFKNPFSTALIIELKNTLFDKKICNF